MSISPTHHSSLRGHYAGFVSRLLAFLIDAAILMVFGSLTISIAAYLFSLIGLDVSACTTFVVDQTNPIMRWICSVKLLLAPFLGVAFAIAYLLFFWSLAGQTPGKALMGVRIVRTDGTRMTFLTALRRLIGYALSLFALGLGFLWMLGDDRRQGWHDKLADTVVVYSWDAHFTDNQFLGRIHKRIIPPAK